MVTHPLPTLILLAALHHITQILHVALRLRVVDGLTAECTEVLTLNIQTPNLLGIALLERIELVDKVGRAEALSGNRVERGRNLTAEQISQTAPEHGSGAVEYVAGRGIAVNVIVSIFAAIWEHELAVIVDTESCQAVTFMTYKNRRDGCFLKCLYT